MTKIQTTVGHLECENGFSLSLKEVTVSFGIDKGMVYQIIDEGILSPVGNEESEWQFDDECVRRIRLVLQLHQDLGVNLAGAGLALELMQQIDELKLQIYNLG